jgi:EmrB/QacA subfamily drug resistance transporter
VTKTQANTRDKTARQRSTERRVLVVSCLALATVVSAVASLNVALPSIARDTHANQTQLSWVIDAYSLVFAALLLPAGGLGDRIGRRRALLAGLVIFGAGSVAAMCWAHADWLIAMRAVLGLGAALVMPATLATITSTFPPTQRARAVGTWAGVAGASAILGLFTSGVVLEQWSWRAVFVVNIVLATFAIIGTRLVPDSADPNAPHIDWRGAAIAVTGLGAFVYSIIEAPTAGWSSVRTIVGAGVGVVLLAAFASVELHTAEPLLDPRLFRHPAFAAGTLSLTLQFFAFFGFIFLLLQYLQLVLADSPLVAALSLVPMALAMMPSARIIAPRMVGRIGTAGTCAVGLTLAAAGFAWLSTLDAASSYWVLLAGLVPLGAGMGVAMTPATSALTDALPADKQGIGSAMNDLSRELGGALGIAVLGSILQSAYRNHLDVTGLPDAAAEHARSSLALAQRLGAVVAHSAQHAFVEGMQYALLASAATVAAAAVAVLVLHHKHR